jgi:protein-tyrosine phosphatase
MNHNSSLPLARPQPSALLDVQFVARRNDPSRVLAASFVPFDYLAQLAQNLDQLYRVPWPDSPWPQHKSFSLRQQIQ